MEAIYLTCSEGRIASGQGFIEKSWLGGGGTVLNRRHYLGRSHTIIVIRDHFLYIHVPALPNLLWRDFWSESVIVVMNLVYRDIENGPGTSSSSSRPTANKCCIYT